jgi:hypothetical protein
MDDGEEKGAKLPPKGINGGSDHEDDEDDYEYDEYLDDEDEVRRLRELTDFTRKSKTETDPRKGGGAE